MSTHCYLHFFDSKEGVTCAHLTTEFKMAVKDFLVCSWTIILFNVTDCYFIIDCFYLNGN